MWFTLSLLSAASKAAYSIAAKGLKDYRVLEITTYSHIVCGLCLAPLILFADIHIPLNSAFMVPAWITTLINVVAFLLLFLAIKISDLSRCMPFLSLTPVFTIVSAYLIRGEMVSSSSIFGIFLITFVAMTIDAKSSRDFVLLGGKRIFQDKGVLLIMLVALLYSLSIVYDKNATLASDPLSFTFFTLEARMITFLLLTFGFVAFYSEPLTVPSQPQSVLIFIMGFTLFTEAIFQMQALQTGYVSEVIAIKRASVLMTSLFGFALFTEQFTVFRLIGALLMILGAAVIYVYV